MLTYSGRIISNTSKKNYSLSLIKGLSLNYYLTLAKRRLIGRLILEELYTDNNKILSYIKPALDILGINKFEQLFYKLSEFPITSGMTLRHIFKKDPFLLIKSFRKIDAFGYEKFIAIVNELDTKNIVGLRCSAYAFQRNPSEFIDSIIEIDKVFIAKFIETAHKITPLFDKNTIKAAYTFDAINFIKMLAHFTSIINKTITELNISLLSGHLDFKTLIKKLNLKVGIFFDEIILINALKSLVLYLKLSPENIVIYHRNTLIPRHIIRDRLAKFNLKRISRHTYNKLNKRNAINLRFYPGDNFEIDIDKPTPSISIPWLPFKYIITEKYTPSTLRGLKKKYGIPAGRKIVTVGSPSRQETKEILNEICRISQYPRNESKPLFIIGATNGIDDIIFEFSKKVNIIIQKGHANRPFDLSNADVFILCSRGELLKFYSIADVALVAVDRNLMEPVSMGVPTYSIEGNWLYNKSIKTILTKNNGMKSINIEHLLPSLLKTLYNEKFAKEMSQNATKAYSQFKKDKLYPAIKAANFFLCMAILAK